MKAVIEINMENAAFEENAEGEHSRILSELANSIQGGSWSDRTRKLYDSDQFETGKFRVLMHERVSTAPAPAPHRRRRKAGSRLRLVNTTQSGR